VICNEDNFVEEISLENNFLKSGSTGAASKIFALSDLKVEAIAEKYVTIVASLTFGFCVFRFSI
jgi:hypothetical protein